MPARLANDNSCAAGILKGIGIVPDPQLVSYDKIGGQENIAGRITQLEHVAPFF